MIDLDFCSRSLLSGQVNLSVYLFIFLLLRQKRPSRRNGSHISGGESVLWLTSYPTASAVTQQKPNPEEVLAMIQSLASVMQKPLTCKQSTLTIV